MRARRRVVIVVVIAVLLALLTMLIPGVFMVLSDPNGDQVLEEAARRREKIVVLKGNFDSGVSDTGLALFAVANPDVEVLSITQCPQVTNNGLASIGQLRRLRKLTLQGRPGFSEAGLVHLRSLSALEELNLLGLEVGVEGVKHIGQLQSLKYLLLSRSRVSNAGADELRRILPKCHIELW